MDFNEAANTRLPYGKYKNLCLDEISVDDDGLRYLDWLRSKIGEWAWVTRIQEALTTYLSDPGIEKDLKGLLSEDYPDEPFPN